MAETDYRQRIELAERLGIPPSQLDGREPEQVTEYEYERGRLVRTTSRFEPRYTERDRAELLALAMYRTWLCPCGCGYLSEETQSQETTGPAFTATRRACRARLALIEAQRALSNPDKPDLNAGARLWRIDMHKR